MRRRDFIKVCSLLGISSSLQAYDRPEHSTPPKSVLVIGAGAAGLASGYLLKQKQIDFQILEASSIYGGRMKRITTFTDFPIPLGAEWLHTSKHELNKIINTSSGIKTQLRGYSGEEKVGYYKNGTISYSSLSEVFGDDFDDKKFINSTWFDFFEKYVVPSIKSKINLNTQVTSINYNGSKIITVDNNGKRYETDHVIITVPLRILQSNAIHFSPALSDKKLDVIQAAPVWGGVKVFLEFTKKFYPTYLTFPDSENATGQRAYFDASYGQNTSSNILGLFAVGKQALQYQASPKHIQLNFILKELDKIFDNKASQTYVKHIIQNWDNEPFIQSAYLADTASPDIPKILSTPIDNKLYFAGDSYTQGDDWGGVHNATQSARDVVEKIMSRYQ